MTRLTRRVLLQRATAATALAAGGGAAVPQAIAPARSRLPKRGGVWLPGDLHTHSTYSHDVWGGLTDDNTGPEESYTAGLPVAGKFLEARLRRLAFLAVTDHNDVRSLADLPSAATRSGVIALPGYEHSLKGHAQLLGIPGDARAIYEAGDQGADAVNAMVARLRDDGGVFQANHPAYKLAVGADVHGCSAGGCADCQELHWTYGFDVRPDTVEVWNPSVSRSDASELYWECWLDRGERIAATGGSDSHWLALHAVAGPGQPTTWVYAPEASARGVLAGLRAGRTFVSGQPPGLGGPRLILEAPGRAMVGDVVPPGAKLQVRAPGLAVPAVVRIRANGGLLLEQPLDPGGTVRFRAPREAGWVRAILLARVALPVSTVTELGDPTPQRDGMPMLALTSPIYVRRPARLR